MRAIFLAYRQSLVVLTMLGCLYSPAQATSLNLAPEPLFLSLSQPPLVMLTLSRDHKLFSEAYNDFTDLDDDGVIDTKYKPGKIDYFGYFDSYKCYNYVLGDYSNGSFLTRHLDETSFPVGYFAPVTATRTPVFTLGMLEADKQAERLSKKDCSGSAGRWSGDWLNYVTTSRMDALLKVLHGGKRGRDTDSATVVLNRSLVPSDGHAWGKEYASVARDGYDISKYTPYSVPDAGKYHVFANMTLGVDNTSTVGAQSAYFSYDQLRVAPPFLRVLKNTTYRVWDWLSIKHPMGRNECGLTRASCGSIEDYIAAVEVCNATVGLEANCRAYGSGPTRYKPAGLFQNYGENDSMFFGLMMTNFTYNTRGGYTASSIRSIRDNIDALGKFPGGQGVLPVLKTLGVLDFQFASGSYGSPLNDFPPHSDCPWIYHKSMVNDQCTSWGSPLGELINEASRYFSGKTRTQSFIHPDSYLLSSKTFEGLMQIPAVNIEWVDPYSAAGKFPYCARPYLLTISDTYPSFDSDAVQGSKFCMEENNTSYPCQGGTKFDSTTYAALPGFDMETVGSDMWKIEFGDNTPRSVFIGQSQNNFDGMPSPKQVNSFGNIRGLAPAEPTRQGSYSSAIAAYYAHTNDLNGAISAQSTSSYVLALESGDPKIEIPMSGSDKITLLPFAKTVHYTGRDTTNPNAFRPTNQIIDFYVEQMANTNSTDTDVTINGGLPYYRFRVHYGALEQGGYHETDAIAIYTVQKIDSSTITVQVDAQSIGAHAVPGTADVIQHLGYVISGAQEMGFAGGAPCAIQSGPPASGIYLDVRDADTLASDPDVTKVTDTNNGDYSFDTRYPTPVTCNATVANLAPPLPTTRTRIFRVDTTKTAIQLENPLWYMAKYGGFSDDNGNKKPDLTEWDANGDGVPDNYFPVANPLNLQTQMSAALSKIAKDSGTAAALASNSTSLRSTLMLYQARFSSDGWGGELNAYPVLANGDLNAAQWSAQYVMAAAATKLNPSTRVVLSYDPQVSGVNSRGIPFRWSSMTSSGTLQSELNKAWSAAGTTVDGRGSQRVDFLRGADVTESLADGSNYFRTRPCISRTSGASCITNYLGDIINSAPQFVGAPTFGYGLPGYKAFYDTWKARTAMVYVGANDGMLHGFDATTGVEKIAYVPSALYRGAKLSRLPAADYGVHTATHAFYVDGAPTFGDVCGGSCATAGDWYTLVVGGLGGGGQGIYALDVTDPSQFTEAHASSLVKWEFNDSDSADLGYTYSRPAIVRLCTTRDTSSSAYPQPCTASRWVVVFGNGYNNDEADGAVTTDATKAHLFILDALTGAVLQKLTTTSAASPNGLATVAAVDVDADGIVDFAYGADLQGNMWKFDLATVAGATIPYVLYQAKTGSGASLKVQSITTTPEVMAHPNGGTLVLFATGKYLENADKATKTQQTVYGIWDKLGAVAGVSRLDDRSNLQQQALISGTQVAVDGASVQETSTVIDPETNEPMIIQKARFLATTDNSVDWSSKLGWYLDLQSTANFLSATPTAPSERVAYDMQLGNQVLNVSTILPTNDICAYGGDSWNYSLNPLTGGRPVVNEFIGAPQVTLGDGTKVYTNARSSTVGISPPGTIITLGRGQGVLYQGGSTGAIEKISIQIPYGLGRRLSWRELETD